MPTRSSLSCFILSQLLPHYINLGHPAVSRRVKGKRFQIVMFFNPMSGWLSYTPICMWRDLFGRLREIGPKCWQHALTISLHTIPPQREKWMLVFDMIQCLPFSLKTWWHTYWSWHRCTRFTQWAWGVYSLQVSLISKDSIEFYRKRVFFIKFFGNGCLDDQ